jgi:hypothetical protein
LETLCFENFCFGFSRELGFVAKMEEKVCVMLKGRHHALERANDARRRLEL